MRFGPVPVADAVGGTLAHAVTVAGTTFRKGRILSAEDADLLARGGVETVVVARLDDGDLTEDAAAARVARAILGPGVSASVAATGRVNIHADAAGLFKVDQAMVDRLNLVDEAITLATLPPLAAVEAGRMVATVKIIPFGVAEAVVERVEAAVGGEAPLLSVAPYRPRAAALVQTMLPGLKASVLDKTVAVTTARLESVGGRLIGEERVAHTAEAVGAAIGHALSAGADLVLLVGASAITDRRDVLPLGVAAAGGVVEHLGMPVDPGNLLMLARVGTVPVLGLPGCARSPKLNGFDWVLGRIAAGIAVDPSSIMRMGVGGLLMDIPSRPLPRREAVAAPPPQIAAVILAAGRSTRMGRNKLLEPMMGKPMLLHAVDAALAARVSRVVVVTGHEAAAVRAAMGGRDVEMVHAPDHAEGLSASLKAGLRAVPETARAALVMLGDMPRVGAALLDQLIAAYAPDEGRTICVPFAGGRQGNPVLWDRRHFAEIMEVSGDQGARGLLARHGDRIALVEVEGDAALLDVDTPDVLEAVRAGSPAIGPVDAADR